MGRGVTVCDWTKMVIEDEATGLVVEIDGTEYVFSAEGWAQMMAHLQGNTPFAVAAAPGVGEDTSKMLTPADIRAPTKTPEQAKAIVADSTVAEEGTLGALGTDRRGAQKRMDAMRKDIDADQKETTERAGFGSSRGG